MTTMHDKNTTQPFVACLVSRDGPHVRVLYRGTLDLDAALALVGRPAQLLCDAQHKSSTLRVARFFSVSPPDLPADAIRSALGLVVS